MEIEDEMRKRGDVFVVRHHHHHHTPMLLAGSL
jgi:hypothetical protein